MSAETITLPLDVVREWFDAYVVTGAISARSVRARVALGDAVQSALWQPPKTEIHWIDASEHPTPENVPLLVQFEDGGAFISTCSLPNAVVRWAWLEGITRSAT